MSQAGNLLSGSKTIVPEVTPPFSANLNGVVNGKTVSFTTMFLGGVPAPSSISNYSGVIDGNTIRGDLDGSSYVPTPVGDVLVTWTGTFTVTIEK